MKAYVIDFYSDLEGATLVGSVHFWAKDDIEARMKGQEIERKERPYDYNIAIVSASPVQILVIQK